MKINEVAQLSGVPLSTIRFYLREGLLPPPMKTGKTMAYYGQEHLKRLAFIKQLQSEKNMPLHFIKGEIAKEFQDKKEDNNLAYSNDYKKDEIINSAIRVFREKGYAATSIQDIVTDSGVGRATFYLFFKNKNEIFIDCFDRLFSELFKGGLEEVRREQDRLVRLQMRARIFLRSYQKWADAVNLLRGASLSNNPVFQEKLNQVMKQIVAPVVRDVEKAVRSGQIRPINSTLAGYMFTGMLEYCGYLYAQGRYDEDVLLKALDDLMMKGLLIEQSSRWSSQKAPTTQPHISTIL
jgi:AcrR family transcriptional regulator